MHKVVVYLEPSPQDLSPIYIATSPRRPVEGRDWQPEHRDWKPAYRDTIDGKVCCWVKVPEMPKSRNVWVKDKQGVRQMAGHVAY